MLSIAFQTLGCKVNQYETDAMEQLFEDKGYLIIDFKEKADIYIINTCTVTNMADKKSRQLINKARKNNKDAIIVVVGCYAQAIGEELKEKTNIDIVIGNNNKNRIVDIIEEYLSTNKVDSNIIDMNKINNYENLSISKVNDKTRAYIKIQDGCNQFCSYCIIPYVRGRVRSRYKKEIIREVNQLVQNGYKEVVLTGIHIASYGIDLENTSLIDLIIELNKIKNLNRIRIGSLEPSLITEEFVSIISKIDKVCPHFHLSLQSGCNDTLKRMNRKYTTDKFLQKVNILRTYYNNPSITTDIIVGFPGETEDEFNQTYNYIKKVSFNDIHVFKYSQREGTKATKLPNQVDANVKNNRSNTLIELSKDLKYNYLNKFINTKQEVLFEDVVNIDNVTYNVGYTKRYLRVGLQTGNNLSNQMIQVYISAMLGDMLY
ncbi:MAG: tRNA (N(6)-L-threonylcarbamoyladenosine(37)-C(2))-methylthiotransferase MtaB [Eubacteriales bacterium]